MSIDTPADKGSNAADESLPTPRFNLTPYARTMSTGEIRAAVATEDDATRERAVRMFRSFNADDHLSALDAAEEILATNPRHALANACATECRALLEKAFVLKTGAVPRVVAGLDAISRAALDHREGFLLSLVDGVLPVEQLADVSGMSEFELLRGFAKLERLGIIRLD